jgi:hypothetical protein
MCEHKTNNHRISNNYNIYVDQCTHTHTHSHTHTLTYTHTHTHTSYTCMHTHAHTHTHTHTHMLSYAMAMYMYTHIHSHLKGETAHMVQKMLISIKIRQYTELLQQAHSLNARIFSRNYSKERGKIDQKAPSRYISMELLLQNRPLDYV